MTTFRYMMEIRRNDGTVYRGESDDFVGALDCLLATVGRSKDGHVIVHASTSVATLEIALQNGVESFKRYSKQAKQS